MLKVLDFNILDWEWKVINDNTHPISGHVNLINIDSHEMPIFVYTKIGFFSCSSNQLTTLKGSPKKVNYWFSCENNKLSNLIGAPIECGSDLYCGYNQLTSLEGCPRIIKYNLYCRNNPNLKYLWGIGRVEGGVYYDNQNEINQWIIECMRRDIIFPHYTLEENINWIKMTGQYSCLINAPKKILKYFSYIIKCGIKNNLFI